ncbi:T9SS type B sorting domain-containing protein [Pontibacter ruber]|uniref:T9SS type B sorting domain-containing protein n=1 Tax=Pontibacter ruber TaxID=1343895 RepID=UPI002028CE74|nr:gliding motility-associated C-terminal domain-containing protein [Pontibacter ruber]
MFAISLLGMLQLVTTHSLFAQGNSVPVIKIDLTGKPNGIWDSRDPKTDVSRRGQICGVDKNVNCIQFEITLDKNAGGLELELASGPEPSGSMFYQLGGCNGRSAAVGEPICVEGVGPHIITLCMPGNAYNDFIVKSIAAFNPQPDISVTGGCSAYLNAPVAFDPASITWRDITGKGIYEKYLSFPDGNKARALVTPGTDAPAYVDYEVCGRSVASPCSTLPYCDVVRVYFYPKPEVTVGPTPAIICPGGSSVVLTGNVTGGDGKFEYIWRNSAGNIVGDALNYTATAVGTYTLEVRTTNSSINCQQFLATVNVVSNLTVNAGPDQLVCSTSPVQLAGTVTAATGGTWSGGAGTFSDRNSLNAIYTPTAAEVSAGSVKLTLTSTGNGSCSPVKDEVLISFYTLDVSLTGTPVICNGTRGTVTASASGAQGAVSYLWNTGETTATISNKVAGTYTVTVKDAKGCSVVRSFTVTEVNGPSDFAATVKSATCGGANGSITVGAVTGGTAPYTYSKDGTTFQASTSFTGLAAGSHNITVKDANGCTFAKGYTITNIAGPTAVTATAQPASCNNNDGSIAVGTVTGGTAPYTYSINGTTFQSGTTFNGLASGTYTVTAKDVNGCVVTASVTITKALLTDFTATASSSTCGNSNGSITVSSVAGGVAPYTYSKDGATFQASSTLSGLTAGTHTITVKDAKGCTFAKQVTITNVAGPSNITASLKSTTCGASNGEITVTATTGGTAPYTYSINGTTFQASASFTGLAAGSYNLTVKDANGCTFAKAFTITNIAGPTVVAATAQTASCANNDGSITVGTVTGGTAPYTYSINGTSFQSGTSFTALASGSYTVTAKDANGCVVTTSVTVAKTMPTGFTAAATSSSCGNSNGSITVSAVVGGTAPYTYSKNGTTFQTSATFTGLTAGTHTITVKDARGCTFAKEVTLSNVPGPSDLVTSVKSSTCGNRNGQVTVSAVTGGTSPYTYSIDGTTYQASNSFASLLAGDYQVRVKDANGCIYTEAVTIQNIAGPAFTATAQASTCGSSNGQIAVSVTGGTAPYTYSKDGTTFQTASTFTNLAAGTYTITVKDANGCVKTSSVAVSNVAGPSNLTLATTASTCGSSNGSISVAGTTGGTAPYTYSIDGTTFQSATTFGALAAREYTVTVKDANGCTYSKKVTVANTGGPTDLTTSVKSATCGASNGEVTVSGLTGGTAPYTYSKDGATFQASASFAALAAGTYTITVKDANGCTFVKQTTVNNIAGPSDFTASLQTSSCGGQNASIRVTAVAGGTAPYTYSKDGATFQTSDTFSALLAGTYTITVKDANGCVFTKEVEVKDVAGPSGFTLAANAATCGASNGSIAVSAVTGGTAPYTYSRNGTTFQTASTFTGLAEGTYTITVKDANGCTFVKEIAVTNIAGPTGLTANTTSSTCGASNGEVIVSGVTGGTAPYTYSKDGVNFQASMTFTGLAAGSHTITVKDANGCTFAKAITITNIAGPSAVAASAQAASCANNDGSITAGTVTGGTAPYTYSINGTSFQSSTSFNSLASGTYTVTAKDANGCTVTTSVTVTKNVPTNFASTTAASTCGQSNGSITVGTVTGGFAPYTYSKDGTNFQASTTLTGLAVGTHTITIKDAKGCTYSKQVTVSNIAGPSNFAASVKSSTCGNSNGELTVTSVTGGTAPYTYSINGTSFQASATFTGLAAGTHAITVKDANGCTFVKDVAVNNVAGPVFTATAQATTCGRSNGSITMSGVTGGTAPYTYSKDGTSFQTSATFSGLTAGSFTISVKDANGCVATEEVEVKDIAGPDNLTLASASSTCGASNGSITVSAVAGGTAPYTYSIDGKTFQTAATFGSVLAGEYTLTVKDANGCTFAKAVAVENIAGPTALTANATSATCGAANGGLNITGVTGGTAPYSYSKDGVNFQASTTFTNLAAGNHTITVKDANGCTVSKAFAVSNVGGPTAVTASATRPATCADNDGSITVGAVSGGTAPYTYSINGTTFQAGTTFNGLASGAYTLTAKDANGCTVTTSVTVTKNVPTNFASNSTASTCGRSDGQVTISGITGGTAPYTYSKDASNFQASASFTGLAAGTYTITVKDANGCTFAKEVAVSNVAGPAFTVKAKATTCGAANGTITVSGTTGGVGPYTYSKDGVTFQASTVFENLLAGNYTITVKDANGCLGTNAVVVEDVAGPNNLVLAGASSTCGNSNASISVSEVQGGTAPYSYSKDGTTFQASATFAGLAAGKHTITVKDANGCTFAKEIEIENIAGPANLTLATASSTCGSNNGQISVTGVEGGTAPFTYSINGTSFQTETRFGAVLAGEYTVTVKDAKGCTFSKKVTVNNIAGPTELTATTKATTCGDANGELTVSGVTGGTAPYSYSKDGVNFQAAATFTELAAGSHTITVKDANGCTVTKAFTVSNIGGPTAVAATSQPASCTDNDGSISAGAVTGGTAPYTYSINGAAFQAGTSFSGLASGAYTLTAKDANGCTVTTTVTISKNIPTTFASTTTASTCGGKNATITVGAVTGGFAPYTYSKDGVNYQASGTLTDLAAGSHTIWVKDAKGCSVSRQVQVSDVAGPSELAVAVKSTTCGNSNGEFSISRVTGGTAPYTYSIDGTNFQSAATFNTLAAGNYQVTVKDANGCTYVQTVTLSDIPGPSDFTATAQASSCGRANGSVTVSAVAGGTAPYSYSKDGTTFQASATLTGLLAGKHTITVKDANGCVMSKVVEVEDVTGPTGLTLASTSSTCGGSNGSISVTGVAGGTAPYTYSINGTSFQAATKFEGVKAGTYTLTVKDANGCTFSKEVKVDNIAGPADLVASAKASTCGAANGALTISGVTGGTAPYSYSKDGVNFQAAATFTELAAGSHTITVKDANGCTFAKAFTVSDVAGPSAVAANAQAATCADNDGSITVGTVTGGTAPYTYSINGNNFQTGTTFAALASGEYTLTVKDANGCEVSTTVKVDKTGPGSFVASAGSSTCGRENGSITVTSVNGGKAPYTYSLNGGAFQSAASFSGLAAAEYTVTVKDANGCTHTQTIEVTDVAGPSDLVASAQSTTCGNSNGQISVTGVTGGTAPYTYSINGTAFQSSAAFTALAAGEYQVTVKDANGCIFAKAVIVTNTNGPEGVALTAQSATCGSSNGQVVVSNVTGGTSPYTYSKDGSTFQASATLTGMAAGTYTITVKDANGCTFAKQVVIGNIDGPTGFDVASTKATCGENNGTITVSGAAGGTAPYTYSINGTDFQATGNFTAVAAGEYTVTVKDANGCTITRKVVVENLKGPAGLTAAATESSCTTNNGTVTVSGVTGGVAPYTYSLGGNNYQAAATFTGLAPGEYEVYAKDASGCRTKATVTVGVKGPKEAVATATAASCGVSNGSLTISSVTGGTQPLSYSINGTTFQASATFRNLAAGSYTVTIKDAEGCTITLQQQVENNGGPESFTATGTDASCGDKNGRISISQVVGGTAPYTYSIDGNNYQAAAEFTALAEGTYQVAVKDAKGCIAIETVTLQNSAPITNLKATAEPGACGQATGQVVVGEVSGGTAPYTYSLDGKNFSAATTITGVAPGDYTLVVKDAKGCTYTTAVKMEATTPVVVKVTPQAKASATAATGRAAVTTISGGTGPYTYQLNNGNFTSDSVFTNLAGGTYTLVAKDSKGCTAQTTFTIETEVEVTPENPENPENPEDPEHETGKLDIPNGFTPNGDGINDRWVLKNLSLLYPNCKVTVYNRWGSLVFEAVGYKTEWDGTHNGKRLPDGTYYCIIEFGNSEAPLKRSVTIMR